MTARAALVRLAILACPLGLLGCRHGAPPPPDAFRVVRTAPDFADAVPVALNQELTVYFSGPVDPLSVTDDTVYVLDEAGHRVRGAARAGSHSVAFVPEVPLRPDLADGSLRPDAAYRLVVRGYPWRDGVYSRTGELAPQFTSAVFRTMPEGGALGMPSPLLAVAGGLRPFVLNQGEAPGRLPADAGRLRLRFSAPVLPTSLHPEAVKLFLLRRSDSHGLRPVVVKGLLLVGAPVVFDEFPGSTLEVEFGAEVEVEGEAAPVRLQPGDMMVATLPRGPRGLTDYAGRALLGPETPACYWEVVGGTVPPVAEWPATPAPWAAADPLLPGFEVLRSGALRPRLRREAGDGSLGVLRPRQDTTLRVGEPFDRGDGTLVRVEGPEFPFLGIDVPAGITVRVAGFREPVTLQACGSIRIAGRLEIEGASPPATLRSGERVSLRAVQDAARCCLIAGGDVLVTGQITGAGEAQPDDQGSKLAVVAAGRIELAGRVPQRPILAVESGAATTAGVAEQPVLAVVDLTPGLPPGAALTLVGHSAWQALGVAHPQARVDLGSLPQGWLLALQFAPPDAVHPDRPDPQAERWAQPRLLADREVIGVVPGTLARVVLEARIRGGEPLPQLASLRLLVP